jgi:16S rRNA (guanine(966)-N(2))-methyltransferase RsmD
MPALRISGGTLRGRRVPVPPRDVRPTSERARQAFFNIIGARINNARFLDLFAGSGIFSFEAVSRGAQSATAVEQSRRNAMEIDRVAAELDVKVRAVTSDVLTAARRVDGEFDVVYADPPYDWNRYDDLLAALDRDFALGDDAVVAIEHRRNTTPFTAEPKRLQFERRAEYGEVWISFWERTTQ